MHIRLVFTKNQHYIWMIVHVGLVGLVSWKLPRGIPVLSFLCQSCLVAG